MVATCQAVLLAPSSFFYPKFRIASKLEKRTLRPIQRPHTCRMYFTYNIPYEEACCMAYELICATFLYVFLAYYKILQLYTTDYSAQGNDWPWKFTIGVSL